jgi:hypothetical protein
VQIWKPLSELDGSLSFNVGFGLGLIFRILIKNDNYLLEGQPVEYFKWVAGAKRQLGRDFIGGRLVVRAGKHRRSWPSTWFLVLLGAGKYSGTFNGSSQFNASVRQMNRHTQRQHNSTIISLL